MPRVGDVDLPVVDLDGDAAERRDAVDEQQGVALAVAERLDVVADTGRRLGVHDGDDGGRRVGGRAAPAGSSGWPQGASTRTTSAPQRPATSHIRSPKTPFTPTTTGSPGRTTLTNAASMPAEPVPLSGKVSGLAVRNTWRRRSQVSSSSSMKSGSRWPSIGRANAACTSG